MPRLMSCHFAIHRTLLLLAGIAIVAGAQASPIDSRPFKISASPAPEALAEFIRQSGFQVLFDFDAIRDIKTRAVSGHLEPAEALAIMFEGSELIFEFINERTVTVRLRDTGATPAVQPSPQP